MRVEVTGLDGDTSGWRQFAACRPGVSIYHDPRWREVFQESFGHRCEYLTARREGRVTGVLPLVRLDTLLFGRFLVSLPFVTYGGLLAEDSASAAALAAAAVELARGCRARHIELRQREEAAIGWGCRDHKVSLAVRLPERIEQAWSALSSRLRGKVRKAERSGAAFAVAGAEGIPGFYAVFARNMRDLGTPVYPGRFFQSIARYFPGELRLFEVRREGRVAAAAFGLLYGEELQLPWICSDYRYSKDYLNEFLYWSVLEWAHGEGLRVVDFGRSTAGSGGHRFKLQWNPEERRLPWYYWSRNGAAPQADPQNPRYRLAIRCWRHLPLALANRLGPPIVRGLP